MLKFEFVVNSVELRADKGVSLMVDFNSDGRVVEIELEPDGEAGGGEGEVSLEEVFFLGVVGEDDRHADAGSVVD